LARKELLLNAKMIEKLSFSNKNSLHAAKIESINIGQKRAPIKCKNDRENFF
jgi:hypothetical protein